VNLNLNLILSDFETEKLKGEESALLEKSYWLLVILMMRFK
jgi:hypothetical protein